MQDKLEIEHLVRELDDCWLIISVCDGHVVRKKVLDFARIDKYIELNEAKLYKRLRPNENK